MFRIVERFVITQFWVRLRLALSEEKLKNDLVCKAFISRNAKSNKRFSDNNILEEGRGKD